MDLAFPALALRPLSTATLGQTPSRPVPRLPTLSVMSRPDPTQSEPPRWAPGRDHQKPLPQTPCRSSGRRFLSEHMASRQLRQSGSRFRGPLWRVLPASRPGAEGSARVKGRIWVPLLLWVTRGCGAERKAAPATWVLPRFAGGQGPGDGILWLERVAWRGATLRTWAG